jgi:hypothetical protein
MGTAPEFAAFVLNGGFSQISLSASRLNGLEDSSFSLQPHTRQVLHPCCVIWSSSKLKNEYERHGAQ